MSDTNGFNIVIEDPKLLFLMQQALGLQEALGIIAAELGHARVQLSLRLREQYPTLNIGEDWVIDLINTRLRRNTLENGEKEVVSPNRDKC